MAKTGTSRIGPTVLLLGLYCSTSSKQLSDGRDPYESLMGACWLCQDKDPNTLKITLPIGPRDIPIPARDFYNPGCLTFMRI